MSTPSSRLQTIWARSQRGPVVLSPCISVCRMDAHSGWCQGCYRSLNEIASWSGLGDEDRRAVWAQVLAREQTALESADERPR
jgi:uncharacterized protein